MIKVLSMNYAEKSGLHQVQPAFASLTLGLPDEVATNALANLIAQHIGQNFRPYRIYLSGNLGTGKTAFARAFLQGLGVNEVIKSPTYTLMEHYLIGLGEFEKHIIHADLYRLHDPEELYDLGLLEENHALWLIEWSEKAKGILPLADFTLDFDYWDQGRSVRLHAQMDSPLMQALLRYFK